MDNSKFDILILIGRPASGKSEIIDYLKNLPAKTRLELYHIGEMDIIDDFPMLWTWFEEDAILSKVLKKPRIHTDEDGYFKYQYQWNLLIERINLEYQKHLRDTPEYHQHFTTIIEFSRGEEHGGYAQAFQQLSADLLMRAGIIYNKVPFEESLRKNRLRFNPHRPDSILEHSLPEEKIKRLYSSDDWENLIKGNGHVIEFNGIHVPHVVFENADDVTSNTPDMLASRLKGATSLLWSTYISNAGKGG